MVADANPVSSILRVFRVGWDSVDVIATCYGLDSLGIKPWWKQDFSAPVQTGPGARPASCTMDTESLSQGHPSPTSTNINERVKLYLYSPSGPSERFLG